MTAWQPIDTAPQSKFVLVRSKAAAGSEYPYHITIAKQRNQMTFVGTWFDPLGVVVRLPNEWMEIPE